MPRIRTVAIMIYLDNSATTRKKPFGVTAALVYNSIANSINAGRGSHRYSLKGAELLTSAADSLASLFNIDEPERIAFTQNATYALNLAILGVLSDGGHAVVTSMEHNSVLRPVHRLGNYTMVWANDRGVCKSVRYRSCYKARYPSYYMHTRFECVWKYSASTRNRRACAQAQCLFLVDAAQSARNTCY